MLEICSNEFGFIRIKAKSLVVWPSIKNWIFRNQIVWEETDRQCLIQINIKCVATNSSEICPEMTFNPFSNIKLRNIESSHSHIKKILEKIYGSSTSRIGAVVEEFSIAHKHIHIHTLLRG